MNVSHGLAVTAVATLCAVVAFADAKTTPATGTQVSGRMVERRGWCSGMAPTEEQLEAVRAPHPVRDAGYAIVEGDTLGDGEPLLTFTTDRSGRFDVQLPPGKWCIVRQSQLAPLTEKQQRSPYHRCLEGVRRTCLRSFEVGGRPVRLGDVERWIPCAWQPECGPQLPPPP